MSDYDDYASETFQNYKFMEKVGNAWKIKNTNSWCFIMDTSTPGPIVFRMRKTASFAPAEILDMEKMVDMLGNATTTNEYESRLINHIRKNLKTQLQDLKENAVKRISVLQEENARLQNLCTARRIVIDNLQMDKKVIYRMYLTFCILIIVAYFIGRLQIL